MTGPFRVTIILAGFALALLPGISLAVSEATPQERAAFWNTVWNGSAPYGVPPLNPARSNPRRSGGSTVWDVGFDSYQDPDTRQPARIRGILAVPDGVPPPGPGGTYPGIVITHSVGSKDFADESTLLLDISTFFAERGWVALAFDLRGYGISRLERLNVDGPLGCAGFLCANLVGDGEEPLDSVWAGFAVDVFAAGEFLAQQPEVWDPDKLAFVGHSLGGLSALHGGIFSERFKILAVSAPAVSSTDFDAWMEYWENSPWRSWADSTPDPAQSFSMLQRTWSFVGAYPAVNDASLQAVNPAWRLDNAAVWLYGGQQDAAVRPQDVEATFLLLDDSNEKAFHWSPTGGHGGPESWDRAQAWLAGHYLGRVRNPPVADLRVVSVADGTVDFSGAGSQDSDILVAWDYDFGDGTTANWGDSISHTYASPGNYVATLTVTNGAGQRDTASVEVEIGGGVPAPELVVDADEPVRVPEGGMATFGVRLTEEPLGDVAVSISFDGGDADLSVLGGALLTFGPQDWDVFQAVTLAAAQDADGTSDGAVFAVTSPGLQTVTVSAQEIDDDARFSFALGRACSVPGGSVSLPVTLSNQDAALVRSIDVTLGFDPDDFSPTGATPGPALPGRAWWTFTVDASSPGMQRISAAEFAEPPDPVTEGVVIESTFAISPTLRRGDYSVSIVSASVNGAIARETLSGVIRLQRRQVARTRAKQELGLIGSLHTHLLLCDATFFGNGDAEVREACTAQVESVFVRLLGRLSTNGDGCGPTADAAESLEKASIDVSSIDLVSGFDPDSAADRNLRRLLALEVSSLSRGLFDAEAGHLKSGRDDKLARQRSRVLESFFRGFAAAVERGEQSGILYQGDTAEAIAAAVQAWVEEARRDVDPFPGP